MGYARDYIIYVTPDRYCTQINAIVFSYCPSLPGLLHFVHSPYRTCEITFLKTNQQNVVAYEMSAPGWHEACGTVVTNQTSWVSRSRVLSILASAVQHHSLLHSHPHMYCIPHPKYVSLIYFTVLARFWVRSQ